MLSGSRLVMVTRHRRHHHRRHHAIIMIVAMTSIAIVIMERSEPRAKTGTTHLRNQEMSQGR